MMVRCPKPKKYPITYTKSSIAGTTLGKGEEETADEDITWNVVNYPPRPASK